MNAEIIVIGDELLIGQVADTNSSWIATELNKVGVSVSKITTIADELTAIINQFEKSFLSADIIITTGGLGPTKDDLTKEACCLHFDDKLIFDEIVFEQLKVFFNKRNQEVTETNRQQAFVPSSCKVLYNEWGTAPGMKFTKSEKTMYVLPGVPFEMKRLMQKYVLPDIIKASDFEIYHKTIYTFGIGESFLADRIKDWEDSLPKEIKLAYLPSRGAVKLRLSCKQQKGNGIENKVDEYAKRLENLIPEHVSKYEKIEESIGHLLKQQSSTMCTAESCTGGGIASRIVSIPGSSAYFKGSVVAYSNDIKMSMLNVSEGTLESHGAVSEQTVVEMAKNARKLFKTDFAISISGIAGPDGGTAEKPVGTVWVAIASENDVKTKLFHFGNDRSENIIRSINSALYYLYLMLKGQL